MRRAVLTLVVALLATAVAAPLAGAGERGTAPSTSAALDRALDRIAAASDGPPGVSVLVERGGRRDFRRRGFADLRTRRRPSPRDRMRIASVSKAFSGAVALSLARAGRLAPRDTIGERLPGLLPLAADVTLAQALRHTGGLPDYIRQPAFVELLLSDPARYMPPRAIVAFVEDQPLEFPPGSEYAYSDTDNFVVGLMAQAATGATYERLLARRVHRPLGLRATSLPRDLRMPKPALRGYEVGDGAPEDVTRLINPALAWASGGIVSTQLDLGRFFRGYVGGRLFGPALRRAQRSFVRGDSSPPGPGRNASGLGLFRYRTRCGTVYGHTGSFPGYRQFAAATSDGRRSVVFTANAQIVPGQGSPRVSKLIRRAQAAAVCHLLR